MGNGHTLTKQLRVRLTEEDSERLERLAAVEQRTVGAIVRRAIRDLLERERKETP